MRPGRRGRPALPLAVFGERRIATQLFQHAEWLFSARSVSICLYLRQHFDTKWPDRRFMKFLNFPRFIVATLFSIACLGNAQVPSVISYQGRVQANGTNFAGTGRFKFAVVSPGTNTSRGATGVATVNNGFVVGITVTAGGAGYTVAPAVTIT